MPRLRLAPAAAALALATACTEDPSFVLRWQVARAADDPEIALQSVRQCSEIGISRVRITTADADGNDVDVREYPCFPDAFAEPDGAVPGPEVGPGEYDVTIIGLTRRGIPRPDPNEPNSSLASDKRKVTVVSTGEGALAGAFRLVGIGECDDGIDNDADGAVDRGDLACRQGQTREDNDSRATIFTFEATLLGGNENATCDGLGVTSLRVTLDGDAASAQSIACTTVPQSFSAYLEPGEHSWVVEGLGPDGEPVTAEISDETSSFVVSEAGFDVVDIRVDLAIDYFDGFTESLRFSVEYEPYPGAPFDRPCNGAGLGLGGLELGTTIVTLRDETGGVVTSATLIDASMDEDAEFPIDGVCAAFDRVRTTSELMWSAAAMQRGYSLEVRTWALADDPATDVPCFSNAAADDLDPDDALVLRPEQLAPGISPAISVPRVRSDGNCADCSSKQDCSGCDTELGICKL